MATELRRVLLTEAISGSALIKKLSPEAKTLFYFMSTSHGLNGHHVFDINDVITWPGNLSRREIVDIFYELESRMFGKVIRDDAGVFFDAVIPLLQSVEIDLGDMDET